MMDDAFENFQTVGDGNNRGMFPSPQHSRLLLNSHDDNNTATKHSAGSLGNAEQQQAQEETSSKEASLYSWSTTLATDSNIWEPYSLNPPPTSDDQRRRSEALQAFLDLARHRETTSSKRQPRGTEAKKEEPTNSSTDNEEQDTKATIESSTKDQPHSIDDVLNVDDCTDLPRIRDYQEQQWEKHYMDLCEFHERKGHCCVPNAYKENLGLARWVKRQRYQYKLHKQGVSKSTMAPHRMKALERLGFVWDPHAALWEEQFYNLRAFCMLYGHCNVPSVFPANPQLSTWVKRQRRQYRANSMCKSREEKLNSIGFDWKTAR